MASEVLSGLQKNYLNKDRDDMDKRELRTKYIAKRQTIPTEIKQEKSRQILENFPSIRMPRISWLMHQEKVRLSQMR